MTVEWFQRKWGALYFKGPKKLWIKESNYNYSGPENFYSHSIIDFKNLLPLKSISEGTQDGFNAEIDSIILLF